jgi:hypothetical protein
MQCSVFFDKMSEICVYYCNEYKGLFHEMKSWTDVHLVHRVGPNTKLVVILEVKDHILLRTIETVIGLEYKPTIISSPTLDMSVFNRLNALTMSRRFLILDFKPFDRNIQSLVTNQEIEHIDLKSVYTEGVPIEHELVFNVSVAESILATKFQKQNRTKSFSLAKTHFSSLCSFKRNDATCCFYTGNQTSNNIDVIQIFGNGFLHELIVPNDVENYFNRYGSAIKEFITKHDQLDCSYHRERMRSILTILKTSH